MSSESGNSQTMNYFIGGGRGGSGGPGLPYGTGGTGGDGMGPSLSFDISVGNLTMNNMLAGNRHRNDCGVETGHRAVHDTVGRPFIHQNIHHHGDRGTSILHQVVALEAIDDSVESYAQPKCHPDTRTKILQDLREWALKTDAKTNIFWLHGPAGAGKSAIMHTLASQLQDAGRLGACFFFKRGDPTRGNGKMLFATIAYQLSINVHWLWAPISQVVQNNPSLIARSIETQMQKLISEPCRPYGTRDPLTIIIDGLDECEGHHIQENILRVLQSTSCDHTLPFRFFVASRPEPHIHEVFESPSYFGHYHSFNVEQSFEDVCRYLRDEFTRIHREHRNMANIPLPWPSSDVLEELVRKSSGHFIYASTIIRFIDDKNYHPARRLAVVQNANLTGFESVFDPLDQLYMTILRAAPRQSELIPILCAIVRFGLRPEGFDQLLRLAEGETRFILRSLHSVLDIPTQVDGISPFRRHGRISSHHASFFDFLKDPRRSGIFCVSTLHHRIDLARSVLVTYGAPPGNADRFWSDFLAYVTPFIISLPPSAEVAGLLPLIGTVDPECIFRSHATEVPTVMLAWLKEIPAGPWDLIKLWEDYECMVSFQATLRWGWHPSPKHTFTCSPEFLRMLVSFVVFQHDWLPEHRGRLDLTWTEMRTSICRRSSNVTRVRHGAFLLAVRLAFRDVALQCIRKMVKNQIDMAL
ncbi:NACHT domain-containing protein [Mycena sanguinolenta]|uniref:NACHT domain-containing protein n=1 Tax=Mycena sanguinolenta TaxID=230812 RepID=A0A8H7DDG2_9AGAR|nr:NACHT domain-containing protein [Mycena sanguinolenta]